MLRLKSCCSSSFSCIFTPALSTTCAILIVLLVTEKLGKTSTKYTVQYKKKLPLPAVTICRHPAFVDGRLVPVRSVDDSIQIFESWITRGGSRTFEDEASKAAISLENPGEIKVGLAWKDSWSLVWSEALTPCYLFKPNAKYPAPAPHLPGHLESITLVQARPTRRYRLDIFIGEHGNLNPAMEPISLPPNKSLHVQILGREEHTERGNGDGDCKPKKT